MATAKQIITQLQAALDGIETVSKVHRGYVTNITTFPTLMIDIESNEESFATYPLQDMALNVIVYGLVKEFKKDTQQDAILDLETEVKKAIFADTTLGNVSIEIEAGTTQYNIFDDPVRGFTLPLKIKYRQNSKERA